MAPESRESPSPAEWKVLRIVADHQPCATRHVVQATADQFGWSTSTTKTLLRRLTEKGHLGARKVGNTFEYRLTKSVRRSLRSAADGLLNSAATGTVGSLLGYMVQKSRLSPAELEDLRQLLEDERRKQNGGRS